MSISTYKSLYLMCFIILDKNKYYVQTQIILATQKPNLKDPNPTQRNPFVACIVFLYWVLKVSTSFFQKKERRQYQDSRGQSQPHNH